MQQDTETEANQRRHSLQIQVGRVPVGGGAPISVQSMTNTDTLDIAATVMQIQSLEQAGADIVRVSVPSLDSVATFADIKRQVTVPLVADIHFDHQIAIAAAQAGADCLRINPGNIGNDQKVAEVIRAAKDQGICLRIGVNAGSLEKSLQRKYGEPNAHALVESAMRHVDILDRHDFQQFKLSIKASSIDMTVAACRLIADQISQPMHLGITEAGSLRAGTVKSALGIGALLMEGIGDTIRVSLAADPVEEVKVAWDLLKALKLRSRGVNLVACPSCARQNFDVISVTNELEERLADVIEDIDVAIIGCYVNGPGESKSAAIGVTGASPANLIYVDGKPNHKVASAALADEIEALVRQRIERKATAQRNLIGKG
ncbi:MAG: flavodoxin-dependent (E)-4-hydroxy-3-methylbut-2-enyl-diphosphate synthase [Gammaproteobacteria bacterium]